MKRQFLYLPQRLYLPLPQRLDQSLSGHRHRLPLHPVI